jgi:hypothetical protein
LCHKVSITYRILKPRHHGAGLITIFDFYRDLVDGFQHELIYRAFLIAFGRHVTETLERDSRSHPVTHWWSLPTRNFEPQFLDSSKGNARSYFNEAGRQQLAHNLAVETFKELELHFVVGSNKAFLDSTAKLTGSKFLEAYLEDMPEETTNEPVEITKIAPTYTVPKETMIAQKNKKTSKTMIDKRPPDLNEKQLKRLEQQRLWVQERRKKAAQGNILSLG